MTPEGDTPAESSFPSAAEQEEAERLKQVAREQEAQVHREAREGGDVTPDKPVDSPPVSAGVPDAAAPSAPVPSQEPNQTD